MCTPPEEPRQRLTKEQQRRKDRNQHDPDNRDRWM